MSVENGLSPFGITQIEGISEEQSEEENMWIYGREWRKLHNCGLQKLYFSLLE
jgi:hypothetical protein